MEEKIVYHIAECDHCKHRALKDKFWPYTNVEVNMALLNSKDYEEYRKLISWVCPACKKRIDTLNIVAIDEEKLREAVIQETGKTPEELMGVKA